MSGLSDPDVGKEDEELVMAVRALPQEDPLPRHLDHYQRSRSLVQIDVSDAPRCAHTKNPGLPTVYTRRHLHFRSLGPPEPARLLF